MRDVEPNGAQPEKGLGRSRSALAATKPVNFVLETERLVAFSRHAHSSSVLLKVMLA
jgi:hypothetical protein